MNREIRNVLLTLTYYATVTIILGLIINSPGGGSAKIMMMGMTGSFAMIISFILLMVNGVLAFVKKRQTKYSFYIHLLVLISCALILIDALP